MCETFVYVTIIVVTCLNIPQVYNAGCNDLEQKNIFECYNSDASSKTSDHLCNDYDFLNNANLSYKVLISTAGKVELTFDLGRNCPHDYEILIKCADNCENVSENYHSKVLYQTQSNDHNLQKCGQTIQVQLEYIFSSCYQITLRTTKGGIDSRIFEKMFIETKFAKELFDANTTDVKYAWTNKQKPAEFFTYVNNKIYKEVLDICMELENTGLYLMWTASCNLDKNNQICNTTMYHGDDHHAVDCTIFQITNILMICRVQNITEGVYDITAMILNEPVRCLRSNNFVWGFANCKVYRTCNMTDVITGYVQEKFEKFVILYLFLFLTLIFTVTIISQIFHYQCKKRIRNNQQDNNLLLNPPDILLLYARDCTPFMVAMITLRNLLENTKVCSKVYDIHDEERREEILTNKINWVPNILRNKNVKILIVLSTCGTRQIHRQTSAIDFYTEPETHEDLFLHTIQILRNESVYSNRKIYVCTFDFTQNERNVLTNLREVKQYLLPNQIKKLIKDLFKTNQYINFDDFNDRCLNFNVYIKNNPHYLRNIIRANSLNMTQL